MKKPNTTPAFNYSVDEDLLKWVRMTNERNKRIREEQDLAEKRDERLKRIQG